MPETLTGGAFMTRPIGDPIMTPERFSEEQLQFMRTAQGFVKHQVVPRIAEIEAKNNPLLRELLAKAGELGLLMCDVPEENDGLGLDKTTSMILQEHMAGSGSWAVTFGAQVGIGMLPIVFFGDPDQRAKYLPKLASGEWVGAYALTESAAGSDALNIRTKAVEDGDHYVLNGTKQWITNAGIADVFTVFAKVDGSKFSAFVVERGDPGVSIGPEEHKLGLRGSSTCEVILEDCRIPKDRLLGRVGRGARIAFGILFMGRLKLGLGALAGVKELLDLSLAYSAERRQFDRPISEFGLVRYKVARIASRQFALEAMGYRSSGLIDDYVAAPDPKGRSKTDRVQDALEEFGVEEAILKVYGSELLDFAVDEAMQIYGGYGFTEDYPIERIYRDSRINRIFEGTNEINRLLISGTLLRKARKKKLNLASLIDQARAALSAASVRPQFDDDKALANERGLAEQIKQLTAYAIGLVLEHRPDGLEDRQDIMGLLADLLIHSFAVESAVQRAVQMAQELGDRPQSTVVAMVQWLLEDSASQVERFARQVAACVLEGDALEAEADNIARLAKRPQVRDFALLEQIATQLYSDGTLKLPS